VRFARYAQKQDASQKAIVTALRATGWLVWIIGYPCDLLCYRAGKWRTLECKTPTKTGKLRKRKDQITQDEFLELTATPRVLTPEDAIKAIDAPAAIVLPEPNEWRVGV
jgi:hypothetical protein